MKRLLGMIFLLVVAGRVEANTKNTAFLTVVADCEMQTVTKGERGDELPPIRLAAITHSRENNWLSHRSLVIENAQVVPLTVHACCQYPLSLHQQGKLSVFQYSLVEIDTLLGTCS